jgi:hypothetical protein
MSVVITAAMNGRLPEDLLAQVPSQPGDIRLATDAAAAFGRLGDALDQAEGWVPHLNTAYRDVATQNELLREGLTTLPGGRSEHGLGRAGDIRGLGGFKGRRYGGLAEVAGEHGWYQPTWATTWRPEPWHWEYDPGRDRHLGDGVVDLRGFDEMASKEEIKAAVAEIVVEALSSMARPVEVYFFTHDGGTFEAQVDDNTYSRVLNEQTLHDRRTILNRAGVHWENWRGLDGTAAVVNPDAFGVLVTRS